MTEPSPVFPSIRLLTLSLALTAAALSGHGQTTSPTGSTDPRQPEQFRQISPRIYCGGEPVNEQTFQMLAGLGVRTIVSVDGAKPDAAAARVNGLRYFHLPFGYDGVPREVMVALGQILQQTKDPVYIHCHHGRHRGPAAAAIAALIDGAADQEKALGILEKAGTSQDYPGLWRDVREFRPLPPGAKAAPLVEIAKVDPVAMAMVAVDRSFDRLLAAEKSGWPAAAGAGRLDTAAEAALLIEGMKEAGRFAKSQGRPEELLRGLASAGSSASDLHETLKGHDRERATGLLQHLKQDCRACHQRYRNP